MKTLITQAQIVAVLYAIFLLVTALLDAAIEISSLNNLVFHSAAFNIALLAGLWLIALLLTWVFRKRHSDE